MMSAPGQAAWPQPEGEILIISTLSDYRVHRRFDAHDQRASSASYHKQELSVYGVYGLSESVTLGAQPTFYRLRAATNLDAGSQGVNGLSSIELFVRKRIFTSRNGVLSAQVLVNQPGPDAPAREPADTGSREAEGRMLYGKSGQLHFYRLDMTYYSTIEAGYRMRGDHAAGQWRGDAAFGVRPWPDYQIIVQSFNTLSVKNPHNHGPGAYDLYKAQISLLRDLPHGVALQIGGFTEYAGHNTGTGKALFVAIWTRF